MTDDYWMEDHPHDTEEDCNSIPRNIRPLRPATARDPECCSSADYAWLMQRRKKAIAEIKPDRDCVLDQKLLGYQKAIDDMIAELQWLLEQEEEFRDGYCSHEDCDRFEQAQGNALRLQDILVNLEEASFLLGQTSS